MWVISASISFQVWPKGKVIFPDFFKEKATRVWVNLTTEHHKRLTFDGLWIDMNEPASFDTNHEKPWNYPTDLPAWALHCTIGDPLEDPQYRPMAAFNYDNITG